MQVTSSLRDALSALFAESDNCKKGQNSCISQNKKTSPLKQLRFNIEFIQQIAIEIAETFGDYGRSRVILKKKRAIMPNSLDEDKHNTVFIDKIGTYQLLAYGAIYKIAEFISVERRRRWSTGVKTILVASKY